MAGTRRLARYLFTELSAWTLLSVSLWVSVLLMNQFFLVARLAIQRALPLKTVFELILLYMPEMLVLALPMGTLLGVLIAVGRLSADHEIVAIQSAGLGPRFLFRPVIALGIVTSLVSLALFGWIFPASSYRIRAIQSSFAATAGIAGEIRPKVFLDQIPGFVLYVDGMPPGQRGVAQGVLLHLSQSDGGDEQLILAREAQIATSGNTAGAVNLTLRNGVSHRFKVSRPDGYRIVRFDGYGPIPLAPPEYLRGSSKPPAPVIANMSILRLRQEIEDAKAEKDAVIRPIRVRAARVEVHARFALPLACFVLSLLALPLGVTRARSGKGAAFALSIIVILFYYLTYPSLRDQALAGRLGVIPGVWTTNAAILALAVFASARLRRPPSDQGLVARWMERGRLLLGRPRRSSAAWTAPEREAPPAGPVFSRKGGLRIVSRLDAYVVKYYFRLALLAAGFTYSIFLLVEVKRLLDVVSTRRPSASLVAAYLAWFTPGTVGLVLPIACLIGAVVTCTLLGRHGELTAMKAGGVSMRRMIAPILVATLAVSAFSFAVQNHLAPDANRRAQEIKDEIEGRSPRTYGPSLGGRWIFGQGGALYHYRFYDPVDRRFQGLSTMQVDLSASPPRLSSHCYSASARWDGAFWELRNGWCRAFAENTDAGGYRTFSVEKSRLDPPEQFERRERTIVRGGDVTDEMTLEELREQIRSLTDGGYDTTRLEVAWHSKIARPLTPLVMVLLGLPFAFKVGRRGSMYGVGVALGLVIVYWAGFAISNALGIEAMLPPVLAAWAPNVLFAGLGAYLLLYIKT